MIDLPGRRGCADLFVEGLRIAFDETVHRGWCDRPVELVVREYFAQPWGHGARNVEVFRDLLNEGVIGIAGPMTTDNALALLPELQTARIPSISIAGTMEYKGDFAFTVQNGGMAEEPMALAAHIRKRGFKNIAFLYESPSQIGEEYARYLRLAAGMYGLSIEAEATLSPLAEASAVDEAFTKLRKADAEALVYFGLGRLTARLTTALRSMDWNPPRFTGAAFVGAAYTELDAQRYDGWEGLDQVDENNPQLIGLMREYERKNQVPMEWPTSVFTCGYDIGRALGIALGRMRIANGSGLKAALETVARLPAATGAEGTVLGFSPMDHRGLKGPDFLVVRRADNGRNTFVSRAPIAFDSVSDEPDQPANGNG